jgi:glycerate 2-kinase
VTELTARELLVMLYETALDSVDGRYLVNQWCRDNKEKLLQESSYTHCVAIGKVAAPMLQGALDAIPGIKKALLISPKSKITRQLRKNKNVVCQASSHPIPDESSIEAGNVLLQFLSQLDKSAKILFLISGGASALVEVPIDGIDLEMLQKINRYLLASGKDIHQINAWRQQFSKIKGGGLLSWINTSSHTQLLLSDVKDDKPEFIGSGLLIKADTQLGKDEYLSRFSVSSDSRDELATESRVETFIIGNINLAKQAVSKAAKAENLNSYVHDEFLEGDVHQVAKYLFSQLDKAEQGVHIWGGEPTVRLPEKPGIGGRNQTLALAFAQYIAEIPDLHLLSAGTDGVDGNSNCAGAVVSMFTSQKAKKMGFDIEAELDKANAGVVLMATDDLIHATSHTNVMDIIIAYKVN